MIIRAHNDGTELSESERRHFALFRGRIAYYQQTGIDLPIERFKARKDENGDYIITIGGDLK